MFSELDTQPGCPSVNASSCRLPDNTHHARPRRLARSFLVRLFHSQLSSGFAPTHPDTFSLSKPPQMGQVFEVHAPLSSEEEGAVKLVETWTSELIFGPDGKVYLVGAKSLFEPARAD